MMYAWLYMSAKRITSENKIRANIRNLKVWLDANELTLNLNKTACLIISPSNTNKNLNLNPRFNDKLIKVLFSRKYLAVFIIS